MQSFPVAQGSQTRQSADSFTEKSSEIKQLANNPVKEKPVKELFHPVEDASVIIGEFSICDYVFFKYNSVITECIELMDYNLRSVSNVKNIEMALMNTHIRNAFKSASTVLEDFLFSTVPVDPGFMFEIKRRADGILIRLAPYVSEFDSDIKSVSNIIKDHFAELQAQSTGLSDIYSAGKSGGIWGGVLTAATAIADQVNIDNHSDEIHARLVDEITPIFDKLKNAVVAGLHELYDFYAESLGINLFGAMLDSKNRSEYYLKKTSRNSDSEFNLKLLMAAVEALPFRNLDWLEHCISFKLDTEHLALLLSKDVFLHVDNKIRKITYRFDNYVAIDGEAGGNQLKLNRLD